MSGDDDFMAHQTLLSVWAFATGFQVELNLQPFAPDDLVNALQRPGDAAMHMHMHRYMRMHVHMNVHIPCTCTCTCTCTGRETRSSSPSCTRGCSSVYSTLRTRLLKCLKLKLHTRLLKRSSRCATRSGRRAGSYDRGWAAPATAPSA